MKNELEKKLNDFINNDQDIYKNYQDQKVNQSKTSDTKYLDRIILAEDGRQLLSE